MSFLNVDVHSDFFTPPEFPVEILELAKQQDVITCCLTPPAKQFLISMLFKELYYKNDGISVFLQEEQPLPETEKICAASESGIPLNLYSGIAPLKTLSSIPIYDLNAAEGTTSTNEFNNPAIIITKRSRFLDLIKNDAALLSRISLVVVDNVHEVLHDEEASKEFLDALFIIRECNKQKTAQGDDMEIRLVFLTVSVLHFYANQTTNFWRMEETFKKLENFCNAKVDTTSDIGALLRYCTAPKERIITYHPSWLPEAPFKLVQEVREILGHLKDFLLVHHFDPVECFGFDPYAPPPPKEKEEKEEIENGDEESDTDSIAEELKKITDPVEEPLKVIDKFEKALDKFGPWCADRSLILLFQLVDRLKVRTPYERHYLLLGAVFTRLVMVQATFRNVFSTITPLEALEVYSTPKLRAVLNILRRFDFSQTSETNSKERKLSGSEDSQHESDDESLSTAKASKPNNDSMGKGKRSRSRPENQMTPTKTKVAPSSDSINDEDKPIATDEANDSANNKKGSTEKIVSDNIGEGCSNKASDEKPERRRRQRFRRRHYVNKKTDNESGTDPQKDEQAGETNATVVQRRGRGNFPRSRNARTEEHSLCGLVLLQDRFDARLLFHFLKEASDVDPKLSGLNPAIAIDRNPEYKRDSKEAEMEHKKREESLRKFRYREANIVIGTSLLEDGIELPKANLVIRFDPSNTFRSYVFSKGRAQAREAEYYIFSEENALPTCLKQLSRFKAVENTLLRYSIKPPPQKQNHKNDIFPADIPKFKSATLANAITIVNRYCARLPSDTFTRLVPLWEIKKITLQDSDESHNTVQYKCNLRLPINSPVKWTIQGMPMPTEHLANAAVALQTVAVLHHNSEIDDELLPIGKEGVKPEPDLPTGEIPVVEEHGEFRPGSTKRRQYYDKQLADELRFSSPKVGHPVYLYWLKMLLTCPLPDEQNTRGRKIHRPEEARQCFGIVTCHEIEHLPPFPIYTRCGEVHVELVRIKDEQDYVLTEDEYSKLSAFHHYCFTSVLRLDKYLTLFDPSSSENSYFVLPLVNKGKETEDLNKSQLDIDWPFIDVIWEHRESERPKPLSDEERKDYTFCRDVYTDAVVMPWYRNHDQPQYFYVAEICENLTPQSQFPGCEFKTFQEYYEKKYNIKIQGVSQPLLDVDHTSARLNFLTPRYVNRKGMALPTSSESTKKAKRENLEQKQILVPELCAIHPFTASLWRQAVCLPCILYRMNALLLSNNVRLRVAKQIRGLGLTTLSEDFKWKPLSFGWTLSDILCGAEDKKITESKLEIKDKAESDSSNNVKEEKVVKDSTSPPKTQENGVAHGQKPKDKKSKQNQKKNQNEEPKVEDVEEEELSGFAKAAKEPVGPGVSLAEFLLFGDKLKGKSANEILSEQMKKCKEPVLEIGVWSNEMATNVPTVEPDEFDEDEDELMDPNIAFPSNLMMCDKNWTWGGRSRLFNHRVHRALYGSPTHWGEVWDQDAFVPIEDFDDPTANDNASVASDLSGSDESFLDEDDNFKIQFHSGNTAEALDKRKLTNTFDQRPLENWDISEDMWWKMDDDTESTQAMEVKMQDSFELEANESAINVGNVISWQNISELPARGVRSEESTEDSSDETKEYNSEFFNQLTPPKVYPESPDYYKTSVISKHLVNSDSKERPFSFDEQPDLHKHEGPSPCQILQALTMSNANDGINLERLETIGDSFLKYAITAYLFCTFGNIHEGKLSHLRSKQVSNVHLYQLGRGRGLGALMVAAKFEPHDNWLPPCYHIPKNFDKALIQSKVPVNNFSMAQVKALKGLPEAEIEQAIKSHAVQTDTEFIPYNLVTQQSIPDKSIADCVEALIGAYLTSMGPYGALLFMSWLGMRVLPSTTIPRSELESKKPEFYMDIPSSDEITVFYKLQPPKSPLLRYSEDCEVQLAKLLKGYEEFEDNIGYHFRDRSYLLQAFTHASYSTNTLTDCYQRLEFLGDAILDYLITRHLYEDPLQHSPGSLTDLRSALVNNTIFASLAVKNSFHKFFRHCSPGLAGVLQKFVAFQEQHKLTLTQDYYLMGEEECEEAEDIEVPKALGDVFESVAGAIFLDSGMSLDAVWHVYYKMMKNEIEQFSKNVPKSPIRELLELEPETAKFGRPEKLWDGRRVRVSVEIFGVGVFRGIGRNYRIAKCTAAKCALRHVRKVRQNQQLKPLS